MATRRAEPLLAWWPFVVMALVAVIDLITGPGLTYLPLLAVGPAFASVSCGVRRAALVGVTALGLCVVLGGYDHILGTRHHILILASIAGVTAAGMLASAGRQNRERELANVRNIAEVAQRVLLRPVPRSAGPIQLAVNYTSAAAEASIGGDLYEVVTTPFGVRIVVGDVQGKGLDAVETAAAVLGAFREAAYDEPELPGIVRRLETAMGRLLGGEKFVTAVLCQISAGNRFTLVNCGHPAPLLLAHDGTVRFTEVSEIAPPLGISDLINAPARADDFLFDAADQMLLYTDGIIEARDTTGRFYPLADRAHLLDLADPDDALTALQSDLVRHTGGPLSDDAAMLLIRRRPR